MNVSRQQQVENLVAHYQQLADEARRTVVEQRAQHETEERNNRMRRGRVLEGSLMLLFQILSQRLPRVFLYSQVEGSTAERSGLEMSWIATKPARSLQVDIDRDTALVAWRLTLDGHPTDWQTADGLVITDAQFEELIDLLADQQTWGQGLVPRCSFGVYDPEGPVLEASVDAGQSAAAAQDPPSLTQ